MSTGSVRKLQTPRIGIALGSGSARGWAHIGVLRALTEADIEPDIVCGTSVGALVGAAYVTGQLDALQAWVCSIRMRDVIALMDVSLGRGGLIAGARLLDGFRNLETDVPIEDLGRVFVAVATEFETGREIWLRQGRLLDAVRASISLPGIFLPHRVGDTWLVDGGLVNPVPVSVCRAQGAEVVIAVNLNGDIIARNVKRAEARARNPRATAGARASAGRRAAEALGRETGALLEKLPAPFQALFQGPLSLTGMARRDRQKAPGFVEVVEGAIYIMQDRITRSRLAGDPPDVIVAPRLGHIRLLDFDRAEEAIDAGYESTKALLPAIRQVVEAGSD